MFCQKCGSKSLEGAEFCQKCGAKLILDESVSQPAEVPVVPKTSMPAESIQTAIPKPISTYPTIPAEPKKKSKKLIFGLFGIVIVAIVAIIIALNMGDKTDYVLTVKAHSPFVSQGLSYTYGTVLNDYIESPVWEASKINDEVDVNVRGKIKDTGGAILVTIKVIPDPRDSSMASITPSAVTIDGDRNGSPNEVVEFLLAVFVAYDEGRSGAPSASQNQTTFLTYANEEHGFSFDYPSDWIDGGSQSATEIIRMYDGKGASISVHENYYLPFELETGDDALIAAAVNELHEFVSVDNTNINGHPMRELIYISEGGVHGPTYVMSYFYINEDMDYQIVFTLPVDTADDYQEVFEAMIDSYTVSDDSHGSDTSSGNSSGSLTADEAVAKVRSWLDSHPSVPHPPYILDTCTETSYEGAGEFYSFMLMDGEEPESILVDKEMGELFYEDWHGFQPLDDWYKNNYGESKPYGSESVMFKDFSVYQFFSTSINDVIDALALGSPADYDVGKYMSEDMDIWFDTSTGKITSIESFSPHLFTVNEVILTKNRAELINLLGEPQNEGDDGAGYYMRYYFDHYSIYLELGDPSAPAWRITISGYDDPSEGDAGY